MNEKQRDALRSIHLEPGFKAHHATAKWLRFNSYLTSDNSLTMRGLHALGIYMHAPYHEVVSQEDVDQLQGKAFFYEEARSCDCCDCGSLHTALDVKLSAAKVLAYHKQTIELANEQIKKTWTKSDDHNFDWEERCGQPHRLAPFVKRKALEDHEKHSDIWYTAGIITGIAQALLRSDKRAHLTSSRKYSFSDTEDELACFLADEGDQLIDFRAETEL